MKNRILRLQDDHGNWFEDDILRHFSNIFQSQNVGYFGQSGVLVMTDCGRVGRNARTLSPRAQLAGG